MTDHPGDVVTVSELYGGALPTTAELVSALLRGFIGLIPGGSLAAEVVGMAWMTMDRLQRAADALQATVEAAGGEEGLMQSVNQDEEIQVLVLNALEAASRTAMLRKRRLLGRVVGHAIHDRATIDTAHLIVRCMENLDAPHIRTLAQVRHFEQHAGLADDEVSFVVSSDESERAQLRRATFENIFVFSKTVPRPITAALINEGCVQEADTYGSVHAVSFTTTFGRNVLQALAFSPSSDRSS